MIVALRATTVSYEGGAKVAELVDALDLGSSGVTRESSSLSFRTSWLDTVHYRRVLRFAQVQIPSNPRAARV